jgi:hypothetical protein
MSETRITRRKLLARAAALSSTGAALASTTSSAAARSRRRHARKKTVALPTPHQVREEFTRMVEFGPRLTASPAHNAYLSWLEDEFDRAGLRLPYCDGYVTDRWLAETVSLEILAGAGAGAGAGASAGAGPVKLATYYPRSQATPPGGITGPLVYGGVAPALSVSGDNLTDLEIAIARYPSELASWASGLTGLLSGAKGSILVVDLPMPVPLTAAAFLPIATYLNWPGHSVADWASIDYKRTWIEPGLGVPLSPFQEMGAAGVVFIVDASYAALKQSYVPFTHGFEPLPAVYVDRDTGLKLRTQTATRPKARLTLTASLGNASTRAITAILPGRSKEVLIFNSHTDGQGFVEENAGVAFVQLARHFASLPAHQRLERTLVFALWPGHMVADLPQTQGWIDTHPDLVKRAAAALSIEHLGCTEWVDDLVGGYHGTGQAEMFGIWTTQGKMFSLTRDTVRAHGIPRAALLRPPVQFGVGAAFQSTGVPQIGAIAGPEYLLIMSPNGELDKLDERLAARQIGWVADLARRLDTVPAAALRQGDPTLGVGASSGPAAPKVKCT